MTTQSLEQSVTESASPLPVSPRPLLALASRAFWQENPELLLAAVTLVALLTGWIGGSLTGALPGWAVGLAAITAYAAGGYSGAKEALEDLRQGQLNIDFLMISAALGAALIGEWEEGALLLFLFTLSGALEEFAIDRTRQAIEGLIDLRPDTASVRRDGAVVQLGVEKLVVGDVVIVKPGERLPVDGTVLKGTSSIDQSPITGESVPVHKEGGDEVYSGTINGSGALEVKVTKLASESTLSKIIELVQEAQKDAAPTQQFIDRFSQPYTLAVIGATLLTILIPWLFTSEPFSDTFYRAMTLLVVASPCALIISTPASILSAIAAAARGGVLFKGGAYLEKAANLDILAFDKTGTLTHGKPALTDIVALNQYTDEQVLAIAASAESLSEHPIARAILNRAEEQGLPVESPQAFRSIAGHGIEATYHRDGRDERIYIGNEKLFAMEAIDIPADIRSIGTQLQKQGKTAMLAVRQDSEENWEAVGYLAVADTVRARAAGTIAYLKKIGIVRIAMVTGDNDSVARAVADQVGLSDADVYADLLPEQKVEIVRELVADGAVGMVGDGVNDAPALATADLGIAMGGAGTDVALETADVVLMSDDLSKLPFMLHLSRRAQAIVRQNIYFSVGVIATLITLTILVPIFVSGFRLPLPLGVVGHEGSTLIVVTNGLRMLALRPK